MTAKDRKSPAHIFAALGDANRLRLVERLCAKGPQSITELAATTDVTRQAVSKHLGVLEEVGLVVADQRGREKIFAIEAKRFEIASEFLQKASLRWESALTKLRLLVEEGEDEG